MVMRKRGQTIRNLASALLVLGMLVLAPRSHAQSTKKTDCKTCHEPQATELGQSVPDNLSCQECHGGSTSYVVAPNDLSRFLNRTPNGEMIFDHGSDFSGKPTRSDVPQACGTCHADVVRMNPYGLRTDQLARYWTSGHGKTLKEKGDDRVAVCVDCHGNHGIMSGSNPASSTYSLNVPATCATCHLDTELMGAYDLSTEVVGEYHQSVHGQLLAQGDTGAPTCASCHGNHSAIPPGFSTVGAVCGQCHDHVAQQFAKTIHAQQEEHKGCVQCHGGGGGRHFHLIERITKPPGVLIERYAHLLESVPSPTPEQVEQAINPNPKQIITQTLTTCTECHDEIDEDESLPKLFVLLDEIAKAQQRYVETANRLDRVGQGVLLVDSQRFKLEDAKTHLIALAPLQHTLDNAVVEAEVVGLNEVCDAVNADLDRLEAGLEARHNAMLPIWVFSVLFSLLLYVKFKQLKSHYVKPLPARAEKS